MHSSTRKPSTNTSPHPTLITGDISSWIIRKVNDVDVLPISCPLSYPRLFRSWLRHLSFPHDVRHASCGA